MADCCAVSPDNIGGDKSICSTCREKGKAVRALTIRSLTKKEWSDFDKITDGYFCTNPNDPTVYYLPEQNLFISKEDVVVRVGIKETKEPIFVCYCFEHTKAEIESDFLEQGYSTIEKDVRQKVKDKLCSCEFKNPSGRCCLGDIRKTYFNIIEPIVV